MGCGVCVCVCVYPYAGNVRTKKDDLKGVKIQQQASRFTFRPKTKEGGNTQFKWTLPSPHWETYIHTLANSQSTFCCYLLNPWQVLDGEGMAIHSSILAWRILMDRGAWGATVHMVGHD